jgi:cytidylate kinase
LRDDFCGRLHPFTDPIRTPDGGEQVQVIFSLASHGGCVIVGREAAQILPEESTLRVRLVGPEARRVAWLEAKFDLTIAEATRWVEETDRRRDRFVRDRFQRDPGDPTQYDLILNSSRLSVNQCADLMVSALQHLKSPAEAATKRPAGDGAVTAMAS